MNSIFQHPNYVLKRQALALTGKFRFYDPLGNLVMFSEQKMFKWREDIRVYADENKTQEVLSIKARQIVDFSAAYDVVDTASDQKVGALRRKGLRSILRDEWEVLDAGDNVKGLLFEDSIGLALLRRLLLGSWLPQNYDISFGEKRVADLRQNFNPFRYELVLDFTMDTAQQLDRRLGRAAGGDQVVDEQDATALGDGVGMDFDTIGAILELVVFADGGGRQLALLADWHEAAAEAIGDGAAYDEATCLDAGHRIDGLAAIGLGQPGDGRLEALGVTEQRRDIAEENAGLRVVGNGPDQAL